MTGENVINSLEEQLNYIKIYAPEYESVIKTQMTIFTKFEYVESFIKMLGFTIFGLLVAIVGLLFIMHFQIKKASSHLSEHTNVLHVS
uniref:Uncharacterized protein n=1 Tax=Panagrolaimus davidi TaxID=227884 RepID=A0A914P5Y5_9BILA